MECCNILPQTHGVFSHGDSAGVNSIFSLLKKSGFVWKRLATALTPAYRCLMLNWWYLPNTMTDANTLELTSTLTSLTQFLNLRLEILRLLEIHFHCNLTLCLGLSTSSHEFTCLSRWTVAQTVGRRCSSKAERNYRTQQKNQNWLQETWWKELCQLGGNSNCVMTLKTSKITVECENVKELI